MRPLLLNIGVATLACLACNALIFGLGWQQGTDAAALRPDALAPPGWVVGAVWVLLFAAMGAARALLDRQMQPGWLAEGRAAPEALRARRLLDLLLLNCLAYPLYTLGLGNEAMTLFGNVLTVGLALAVAAAAWPASRLAAGLLLPVAAWVGFATLAVLRAAGMV